MALAAGQTGHLADHQEGVYQVTHGATAGTTRPTLGSASTAPNVVLWNGSVEPTNATDGDLWWDSTNSLMKVRVSGSFVASGSGAYLPVTDSTFIDAGRIQASGESTNRATFASRIEGWTLDPGLNETLRASWFPKSGQSTYSVYVWWGNRGSGSGDVKFRLAYYSRGDGEDATTGETLVDTTLTAGAQNVLERSQLGAGGFTITAGELHNVRVTRLGSDAADTLADEISVVAFEIVPA